nr:hypothetical protein [Actinomycetota bacterium]
ARRGRRRLHDRPDEATMIGKAPSGPVVVVVPVVVRRGVVHTRALYKALRHLLRYYDHYHHYGAGTAR